MNTLLEILKFSSECVLIGMEDSFRTAYNLDILVVIWVRWCWLTLYCTTVLMLWCFLELENYRCLNWYTCFGVKVCVGNFSIFFFGMILHFLVSCRSFCIIWWHYRELLELMQAGTLDPEVAFLNAALVCAFKIIKFCVGLLLKTFVCNTRGLWGRSRMCSLS